MSTDTIQFASPFSLGDAIATRRSARAARRRLLPQRTLLVLADLLPIGLAVWLFTGSSAIAAATAVLGTLALTPVRAGTQLNPTLGPELPSIAGRVGTSTILVALATGTDLTATGSLLAIPAAVAGVALARTLARIVVRAARRRGFGLEPTLIVGSGPIGVQVAETLRARREFGLSPIGVLDDAPPEDSDLPHLGDVRDLASTVLAHDARRVILAFGSAREAQMISVLRDCASLPFDVHFHALPRFFELGTNGDRRTDDVWGFPLVKLNYGARSRSWAMKRLFDQVMAATLLVITAPLMLVLAVLVKLTSPGPVLYRQQRVGQWGRHFEMLKFRTMRQDADDDDRWETPTDRITSVGRFLRPSHLDELPQLLNVLRGDMSIVGPRPERPLYVDHWTVKIPRYEDRHRVPVGLTGWAQVHGLWGETSIEDRARFDNRYIEDWSLWRDLLIVLRTIPTLLGSSDEESALTEADTVVLAAAPQETAPEGRTGIDNVA